MSRDNRKKLHPLPRKQLDDLINALEPHQARAFRKFERGHFAEWRHVCLYEWATTDRSSWPLQMAVLESLIMATETKGASSHPLFDPPGVLPPRLPTRR